MPLSSFVTMRSTNGPEFTLRYNEYRSAQINGILKPGVSTSQGRKALEEVFAQTMPSEMGFDYMGMSYQEHNINDPMTRVPGIGQVQISGAGQCAMRFWVRPDTLAKLEITVNDIVSAIQAQKTVNAAGQIGGNPVPPGQQFTYTVRASSARACPPASSPRRTRATCP